MQDQDWAPPSSAAIQPTPINVPTLLPTFARTTTSRMLAQPVAHQVYRMEYQAQEAEDVARVVRTGG